MSRERAAAMALLSTVALLPRTVVAEVELPRRSPKAHVSQQVGLTQISVDYNSPAVRGRAIWGAVVPLGEPWRSEESPAARLTVSRDVVIADQKVPAGTYALLMMPAKGDWTLILNRNAALGESSRDYKPEQDLARVKVHARPAPPRERLVFLFSDFTDEQATLDLEWEKVRVSIPIKVGTREQLLADIGALDDVWRSYANVARYMLETKKDYDAGLKYIDRSLALGEDWYNVWIKASLLAAKGRYRDAHDEADRAYRMARATAEASVSPAEMQKAIADWGRAADRQAPAARNGKKRVVAGGVVAPAAGAGPGALEPARFAEPTAGEAPPTAAADVAPPKEPAALEAPASVPSPPAPPPPAINGPKEPPAATAAETAKETAKERVQEKAKAKDEEKAPGAGKEHVPASKPPALPEAAPKKESAAPDLPAVAAPPPALAEERPALPVRAVAPQADAARTAAAPKPAEIAPVIERGRADIHSCYQRALRQDPSLAAHGKITISISVGSSGLVKNVALDSPNRLRALEPCIKGVVSRWAFPPSPAEYGTELPIVLQGKE
jgi:outer membrane biosynthesis protein TonB